MPSWCPSRATIAVTNSTGLVQAPPSPFRIGLMLLVLSHVKYLLLGFPLIVMHTIACTHVSRKVRTALGQPPGPKGKTLRLMVSPAAADDDAGDAAGNDDTSNNARARDLNRLVVRIVENDIDNGVKRRCWHFN